MGNDIAKGVGVRLVSESGVGVLPTEAKVENRKLMRELVERGGKGRWSSRRS
jgi:hypothetical protein